MKVSLYYVLLVLTIPAFGFDTSVLGLYTIANRTGFDLHHIFISPGDSSSWGADILSSGKTPAILPPADTYSFYVHYELNNPVFALLAIDEDGDSYVMNEIPGQDTLYLEIGLEHYDQPSARVPPADRIVLTNAGSSNIWFMFLSPTDSLVWGADILGDKGMFESGESISIRMYPDETDYDLLGVTENGEMYYR
ncbi:MAG: hypothetical protein ACR2PY_04790, partial [Salinispira sp.]